MQFTVKSVRLTGLAFLAVSVTALSVGACSSSHDDKPPAASPSPSVGKGKDAVRGLIASVSGDSIQVTETAGTASVGVTSATKITEWSQAQLSDVAAGSCVTVLANGVPAPGGGVTAHSVSVSHQGGDSKCAQPKAGSRNVVGTVASVAGNTINVSVTDASGNPAQTAVAVNDATKYNKGVSIKSQDIAQGKCIAAQGTKDGGGTLQATVVTLNPAHDGKCPQAAAKKK